jgi:hypothetical protein
MNSAVFRLPLNEFPGSLSFLLSICRFLPLIADTL